MCPTPPLVRHLGRLAGYAPGLKVIYRDFYARGVGLVRSVTADPSGNDANRIEQVLLEYFIP